MTTTKLTYDDLGRKPTKGELRFAHAHDWFQQFAKRQSKERLLRISNQLALKLDSDQIQELFEREMDADGYFES